MGTQNQLFVCTAQASILHIHACIWPGWFAVTTQCLLQLLSVIPSRRRNSSHALGGPSQCAGSASQIYRCFRVSTWIFRLRGAISPALCSGHRILCNTQRPPPPAVHEPRWNQRKIHARNQHQSSKYPFFALFAANAKHSFRRSTAKNIVAG